ncbi:MAG: DUF2784 domain-containing protein [Planctomycetaceae bacterium]|nr:DUF2784 domain-containing protein [Planctomycetaceae bacterium]
MPMFYRLLADLIVVVHFAYVLSVILGLVAILMGRVLKWDWVRNRWFRGLHLAMILIVVLEAWIGFTCPLTTWENQLRSLAGQSTHKGAFIADYVHELLFIDAEPWVFTLCYTLFGTAVIASLFLVPPRWRKSQTV